MRFADGSYEVCRLGHHLVCAFTETDGNGQAHLQLQTRLCEQCMAATEGL